MSIYMKVNGINGDVTAKEHQQWIELSSASIDLARPASVVVGRAETRHTGNISFSSFTVRKPADSASNDLFQQACTADSLGNVEIDVCPADSQTPLIKYVLHDVIVHQVSTSVHSHGTPVETLKLHYTKLEHHFIGRDSKNRPKSPSRAGFDLTQGTKM